MYQRIARSTRDINRQSNSIDEKKDIGANQVAAWKSYVDVRYGVLPEELQFTNKMRQNLLTLYQVFRERKVGLLESKFMLEFMNEYAKVHKFEVPIDAELLIKQIHPQVGYLTKIDKFVEFETIEEFFKILLVASFEKLQGQTLLASEVCSLGYWMHADKKLNGYLDLHNFSKLMSIFNYPVGEWSQFQQEFPLVFKYFGEDLLKDSRGTVSDKNVVPFDVFRYIYLERNL